MVAPSQGDTNLPPGNTFVWALAPAWTELIQVDLIDPAPDDGVDEALFFDPTTTSWTPSGVVPGTTYFFELSFIDAYFLGDARTSAMGRTYALTSGFQAYDRKFVPEPGLVGSLAIGVMFLAANRKRTAGPRRI